jgi:hypothetical protein
MNVLLRNGVFEQAGKRAGKIRKFGLAGRGI